jgi:hypothetical protein
VTTVYCGVTEDLLLGINAHMNHDLSFALTNVSIDPNRYERHREHTGVNDALREATHLIEERFAKLYAPGLKLLDRVAGPLDEDITNFSNDRSSNSDSTSGSHERVVLASPMHER